MRSTSASWAIRQSTFPIDWHNSKIPGYALHVNVPTIHGFSAYAVMSSVAARFFPPQSAGAGAAPQTGGLPFRIDHDEKFNQTTHLQYQFGKRGPWAGWNWRYDSGLVAGAVPFATDNTTPVDLSGLTYDQQFQAGHHVQWREGHSGRGLPVLRPIAVQFNAGQHSCARNGERRQEPATHCPTAPIRRLRRSAQHLP